MSYTVDQWYDHHTRSWVTQLKDSEGNQVGEAEYDGTRESAEVSREWKENEAKQLAEEEK